MPLYNVLLNANVLVLRVGAASFSEAVRDASIVLSDELRDVDGIFLQGIQRVSVDYAGEEPDKK